MEQSQNEIIRLVTGELRVLESSNTKLKPIEIYALNNKVNRNGWLYTDLAGHIDEFRDIPILTAYVNGKVGDGHNYDVRVDPASGREYASFTADDAERIVGWINKDANIRVEKDGDTEWLVVTGYLWSFYAKELIDKIARQGGMEVSIETLVTKEHNENGVDVEDEYIVLGITVLGDGIMPAVAGANIKTLAELSNIRDGMKKEIMKAASYIEMENEESTHLHDKGVKKMTEFNKRQIAELKPCFAGYTVLAAMQDENGIHVCLMDAAGDASTYTMETLGETIVPEKFVKVNAQVMFDFNGTQVGVDACDVIDELTAKIATANSELETAKANFNSATETINAMRNAENKRRVIAAKEKAQDVLDAFNANRDEKIEVKVLSAVNADIDNGAFTDIVDADGMWIGDAAVKEKVLSACAIEVMESDKRRADSNKNTHIWNKVGAAPIDDGTVAGLLQKKGIR